MASIEGTKVFLGELDKVQRRLNDAVRSANDIGREALNFELTLGQQGLKVVTDPQTGQSVIQPQTAEENIFLQAKRTTRDALAIADQDLSNTLRQRQIGADISTLESPEAKRLRTLTGQIKREERVEDVQGKIDAEVAARESKSGKKLSKLQRDEVSETIKSEAKAKAEAAVTPQAIAARQQIELTRILTQTSPEAIKSRQILFNERMNEKALLLEQDLRLNQRASEQEIAFKLEQFKAAQNEILTFTNTRDVVQAAKIYESIFGVAPGTLNPLSTDEQLAALGERREIKATQKAQEQSQITAAIDQSIEVAFEAIDFDFTDLTDKRDLNELIKDDLNFSALDKVITDISSSTGFSDKQVAAAILSKIGLQITQAIKDVEAGELFDTEATEKLSAKKLRTIRDRLKRVKKSGFE